MARYTYKETGDNKDSNCLVTTIYDGMDIMAIVYDYGDEVEVEPKRDLTDEESDMVKQFCESLDYEQRTKVEECLMSSTKSIMELYNEAREDFGENKSTSLNESVKRKPETVKEKLMRLDRQIFDEEFRDAHLAYDYSMINEDVVGKKVDMKTKQELRDFINREDDPNKIAKFMDVIINGGDKNKINRPNNNIQQQTNIRTESLELNDDILEECNRNGWTVMKQGKGMRAYNYSVEHDSTIEPTQESLENFLSEENHLIDDLEALSDEITYNFGINNEGHPVGTITDWRKEEVAEPTNDEDEY